jgi:hypothetical protein
LLHNLCDFRWPELSQFAGEFLAIARSSVSRVRVVKFERRSTRLITLHSPRFTAANPIARPCCRRASGRPLRPGRAILTGNVAPNARTRPELEQYKTTSTGMRQEVDIRYVVTSLKGSAQHLYENVYCQRGQMENLIKLHKAQPASDRIG